MKLTHELIIWKTIQMDLTFILIVIFLLLNGFSLAFIYVCGWDKNCVALVRVCKKSNKKKSLSEHQNDVIIFYVKVSEFRVRDIEGNFVKKNFKNLTVF